jgi:hypothetical protein
MVFTQQLTRLVGGWRALTRECGQALSPSHDAFAYSGPRHPGHQLSEIGAVVPNVSNALVIRFLGSSCLDNTWSLDLEILCRHFTLIRDFVTTQVACI